MKENIIEILTELRPEFDFTDNVNFIEEGMIDSLDIVNLVAELESTFSINIDGLDVVPENFSTIENIINLLVKTGMK
jgi:Phosphopantetheine attachment site.